MNLFLPNGIKAGTESEQQPASLRDEAGNSDAIRYQTWSQPIQTEAKIHKLSLQTP